MYALKKILKRIGIFILAVFLLINVFILVSGRFYLYKGIGYTYLSGKTGPTIYDLDKFERSSILPSKKVFTWKQAKSFNKYFLTKEQSKYFSSLRTKAILVFKGDQILFEHYYDGHTPTTVSNSFSAAKTIVSLLIGCALDEAKIKSLDEPIGNYLEVFNNDDKNKITIRHLLMMASGLDWKESGKNPLSDNAASYYGEDLYNLVTTQELITEPGKKFLYQSGNSQLLGYIIEKATGKSLNEYAQEKLWSKIGAENEAFWSLDKEGGDEKAFCCMYATARDFGKIGRLINHGGELGGTTIISKAFMSELIKNPSMLIEDKTENYRYGLHIWTYLGDKNPVYYCRGILGQYIISIPEEDIVIVRLGSKRDKTVKLSQESNHTEKEIFKAGHPADLFKLIELGKKVTLQK